MTERVAIVGSRPEYDPRFNGRLTDSSLARRKAVFDYVEGLARVTKDITIVTGGAPGVDQWAEDAARRFGLLVDVRAADWKRHGQGAGMMRNGEIIASSDRVVAFWDGISKGTADTISKAKKAGKPVEVFT
jgi:hypothetical protein